MPDFTHSTNKTRRILGEALERAADAGEWGEADIDRVISELAGLPSGTGLARVHAPEAAALMDVMKDQLVIALLRRLGGALVPIVMPAIELDTTGDWKLLLRVEGDAFRFELEQVR